MFFVVSYVCVMSLVTVEDIATVLKISRSKLLANIIGKFFLKITKLSVANKIYELNKDKKGLDFLNSVLDDLGINFDISQENLAKIPKKGGFITISNHPLGGIDGILLLKILLAQRSDFKIIANFLLQRIEPLQPYIMPVNPFEDKKGVKSSIVGIKSAIAHLNSGGALGIFPAGEVSTFKNGNQIIDRNWEEGAIKFIKRSKVPVIPIYFDARNSTLFYLFSRLNPALRTAKLPSEMFKQKNKKINIRIGNPISVKEQELYDDTHEYGMLLRRATFVLHQDANKKNKPLLNQSPETIEKQQDKKLLLQDIYSLTDKDLISTKNNYDLYFVKYEQIPNIIREIGRLREEVYRSIGEGTQRSIDLDDYDRYYRHLFIWDREKNELAGSYRLGLGSEIYDRYGQKGFYLDHFFKFGGPQQDFLQNSIEMGRAFLHLDYQRKTLPLLLLFKGILTIATKYSRLRRLVGSVSISDHFSIFSKTLMIAFFDYYFKDEPVSKHIKTRKPYECSFAKENLDFIFKDTQGNMRDFDKRIVELESQTKMGIPTFLRFYVEHNAKVVGFAIDPDFNNCLDVLMYVNIDEIPKDGILSRI